MAFNSFSLMGLFVFLGIVTWVSLAVIGVQVFKTSIYYNKYTVAYLILFAPVLMPLAAIVWLVDRLAEGKITVKDVGTVLAIVGVCFVMGWIEVQDPGFQYLPACTTVKIRSK